MENFSAKEEKIIQKKSCIRIQEKTGRHYIAQKQKKTHRHREQTCGGQGWGRGTGWDLGVVEDCCLENPMGGGAWWAAVHGVAKSWARLSDFTFAFHFPALEKEMATHSSVLAWRISGTGEPGGLPSRGSHRVGHD